MAYKIREVRKELRMSQQELSKKSGVSRTIISGLETGKIKVTTTDTILKLADSMGKSVNDIFF